MSRVVGLVTAKSASHSICLFIIQIDLFFDLFADLRDVPTAVRRDVGIKNGCDGLFCKKSFEFFFISFDPGVAVRACHG